MQDPDVDAVVSVVPPHEHTAVVDAAIEVNKPLLLEKPLALDTATAQLIHARVLEAGLPVLMAQTMRLDGVVRTMLREQHRIGELHALNLSQQFEPEPREWTHQSKTAGGGMLVHTGVHLFDLLWAFTGHEVASVRCETTQVGDSPLANNYAATLKFEGGITLATISGSRATQSRSGLMHLVGSQGQLVGDYVRGSLAFLRDRESEPIPIPPSSPPVQAMLDIFEEGLRENKPFPITTMDGLRAITLADACVASAEQGLTINPRL